jgi:hypothetical protein
MAVRTPELITASLYERDPYAWLREQAAHLRARRFEAMDLPNLIEEVEDLAGSLHRSARSRVRTIIEHLLKLEHSPATDPRAGWRHTVRVQRDDLGDDLTATLRQDIVRELDELYAQARARTAAAMLDHGEREAAARLPASRPYSLEQIEGEWLP